MNQNAPHPHQHPHTLSDAKSPALVLSPRGSIWSSSPSANQGWTDAPDRWSQTGAMPPRDPLQPSHNIPSIRDQKDIGPVARGDLLKEYQRVKEDYMEQSRRSRVGAIGEGRAGSGRIQQPQVSLDFASIASPRVFCPTLASGTRER